MKNGYIGVFDSGLGGLSVMNELYKLMPHEKFLYLADSKNNPYGLKSKKNITDLSINCVKRLLDFNVKTVVVACNTATVNSINVLNKIFNDIKIFGTYPTLKKIIINNKNQIIKNTNIDIKIVNKKIIKSINTEKKNILILSTTATKKSKYIKNEIKSYKKFFNIFIEEADEIVRYVEKADIENMNLKNYIKNIICKYKKIDNILLACTHFNFVETIIKKFIYNDCFITSNTDLPANECYNYLYKNNLLNNNKTEIKIIDTLFDKNREIIYKKLLNNNNLEFIY